MMRPVILLIMIAAVLLTPRFVGDRVRQMERTLSTRSVRAVEPQGEEEPTAKAPGHGFSDAAASRATVNRQPLHAWTHATALSRQTLKTVFAMCRDLHLLLLCLSGLFLVLSMGFALAASMVKRYSLARLSCQTVFAVGSWELAALAVLAVMAHLCRINFFAAVPILIWVTPLVFILVAAGALRRIDMNYPLWNATLRAVFFPLLAGTIVLEWDRIAVAVQRFG